MKKKFILIPILFLCVLFLSGCTNVEIPPTYVKPVNPEIKQEITINHNFVDENLSNFPILINLSNNIVSKADNGDSLRFYNSDNTLLAHEIDYWNTYGLVWVNVTSISSTEDTTVYLYYNDSDASSVENPTGVWDSHYVGVWHMNKDNATHTWDSTSNDNHGELKNGVTENNSGIIGNAFDFDGVDDYIETPIFPDSTLKHYTFLGRFRNDDDYDFSGVHDSNNHRFYLGHDNINGYIAGYGNSYIFAPVLSFTSDVLNLVLNVDDSVPVMQFYINGAIRNTDNSYSFSGTSLDAMTFGASSGVSNRYNGTIDEVRISNIARSSAWINLTYDSNNQTEGLITFSENQGQLLIWDEQSEDWVLTEIEPDKIWEDTITLKHGVWLAASGIQAPGLKPATFVKLGCDGAWEFSDNQEETISFNIRIPASINLSDPVNLDIGWSSPATDLDCNFNVTYSITALNEDTSIEYEYYQDVYSTSSSTANGLSIQSFSITELASGDRCLHIQIERDGNDANDTLSDDAHVHGICVRYYVDFTKE